MPLYEKKHEHHENHLCEIVGNGATLPDYMKLVKEGHFVCRQCGRVAAKEGNLCDPVPLG